MRATLDQVETGTNNLNSRALVAVNADSEIIPATRANGVLAALAVPRAGVAGGVGGISALLQLDGWTWEDMGGLVREAGLHVFLPAMRFGTAMTPTLSAARIEEMQRPPTARLRVLDDEFENGNCLCQGRRRGRRYDRGHAHGVDAPPIRGQTPGILSMQTTSPKSAMRSDLPSVTA